MSAYIVPQFSDLELFGMFNIDVRAALLQQAKSVRHTDKAKARKLVKAARKAGAGRNAWYMNKKQRSGTIHDLEATSEKEDSSIRQARIDSYREFYGKLTPEDMQAKEYREVKKDGEVIGIEAIKGAVMPASPLMG